MCEVKSLNYRLAETYKYIFGQRLDQLTKAINKKEINKIKYLLSNYEIEINSDIRELNPLGHLKNHLAWKASISWDLEMILAIAESLSLTESGKFKTQLTYNIRGDEDFEEKMNELLDSNFIYNDDLFDFTPHKEAEEWMSEELYEKYEMKMEEWYERDLKKKAMKELLERNELIF